MSTPPVPRRACANLSRPLGRFFTCETRRSSRAGGRGAAGQDRLVETIFLSECVFRRKGGGGRRLCAYSG